MPQPSGYENLTKRGRKYDLVILCSGKIDEAGSLYTTQLENTSEK